MKKLFKRLFCRHERSKIVFVNDGADTYSQWYETLVCTDCGKTIFSKKFPW